ncbi:uncharacterized protein LOC131858220 [Cryptomeria japonica]|uniref:uncharacterized protein LOC131858220 n=1 Tax=Cryptomeria japonica TaxID=3369 RepID=UPI0027DA92BB|nr:uncharacterized protein LOC131858220 [Cryptomeria japonica]
MVFSNKKKRNQYKFYFEGSILEEDSNYKYLGIGFNKNLNWDGCRKKRILGGWKGWYALQNRCREAELRNWKASQTLLGLLVLPVILYGCELWASNTSGSQWKQSEQIQKHLITSKFKIKNTVPYEIMLSETGVAPIEAIVMVRLISYLKRIGTMEEGRWSKAVFNDTLCKRKKTWMQQNIKWLSKWNIYLNSCPTNSKEIKAFVMDKFHKWAWGNELARKKKYYITKFNSAYDHHQKAYIRAYISWKAKCIIAQLRTNSHQLHSEIGCWKRPKETWEERVCIFCTSGKVETEKHFILECDVFKDVRDKYNKLLTEGSWYDLFSEDFVERLGPLVSILHRKRADLQKSVRSYVLSHRLC